MVRKLIKALLAGSVLIPTLSFGLGLGEIHLHSGLNENLNAEIDLLSVEPSEADKITASLASYDTFNKIGLERSPDLMLLSFQVEKHKDGSPYIKITSKNPINDPFLDFLVQVNWPSGQILREYTILLNPPQVTQEEATPVAAPTTEEEQPPVPQSQQTAPLAAPSPAVSTAPAMAAAAGQPQATEAAPAKASAAEQPAPQAAVAPSKTAPKEEAPLSAAAAQSETAAKPEVKEQPLVTGEQKPLAPEVVATPAPAVQTSYGPVKRNENLYRIASRMRPDSQVTVDQTMIALFNANRDAFIGNNINRLKKGAVLRLEDPAAIKAINQAEARREVARHNQAWQDYRAKLAAKTPAAPAGEPTAGQQAEMAAGTAVASKEEPKLSLVAPSKGGKNKQAVGGTAEKGGDVESLRKELMLANETAEARRKENEDLNNRLKELEGQLDKMQKLLALKDDNLAAMQQQLATQQKAAAAGTAAKSAQPQTPVAAPVQPTQPEATKPAQPAAPEQPLAAPAETTAPVDAAKPVTAPAEPKKPAQDPSAPAQPAAADASAAVKAPGDAAPATPPAAKPAEVKPAVTKPVIKRRPLDPLPPPETSFIDDLLGDPVMLGGGAAGVVILILGVMLILRRRRQGRGFQESILTVGTTSSMMKGKGENPASETSFLSDLAVSGMGSSKLHEEGDVDPLTEADVYMAYNRFSQAEELLKEGLKHSPDRDDLNAKLLEVYYRAKNPKEFELLAEARSTSMQKDSAMWQKVMAMGHELCPDNPLFQGAESDGVSQLASAGEEHAVSSDVFDIGLDLDALSSEMEEAGAPSSDFNVDLGLDFSDLGSEEVEAKKKTDELETVPSFDIDLGTVAEEEAAPAVAEEPLFDLSALSEEMGEGQPVATEPVKAEETLLGDLDFDLSALGEEPAAEEAPAESLEFSDLDLGELATEAPASEEIAPVADFGDFDLASLGEESAAEEQGAESLDFGDLDLGGAAEDSGGLDFGGMELGSTAEEPTMDLGDFGDLGDLGDLGDEEGFGSLDEIGTKLDLAKAYVDMGDSDGARGMLEEVIQDGSDDQKRQAQELLEQIA